MPAFDDLTDRRFGLVVATSRNFEKTKPRWNCLCDCGNTVVLRADYLKSATSPSCGCLTKTLISETSTTHGLSKSAEYRTWVGMRSRCYNPTNAAYYKYGARGIKMCERWFDFEDFYEDMGPKPSPAHTLDRIDGTKDYSPDNCRWATRLEQQRNLKNNVRYTFQEKSLTLAEWSEIVGFDAKTLHSRILKLGWSVEEALTLPRNYYHKRRSKKSNPEALATS